MDCPWRRTLASVFLLLSPHNLRVLSQNVVPLPPLPLLRELQRDNSLIPGPVPQQMNFLPGPPNGMLPEYVPLGLGPEYQRIPENGPVYPQCLPYNSVSQANTGQFSQVPVYNTPMNTNVPPLQGLQPNNFQTPLVPVLPGAPLNIPSVTNISPNIIPAPLLPIPQEPNFNGPPLPNGPFLQGLPCNIPTVPLVPMPQGQILPSPQVPLAPINTGPPNVPPGFQIQNMQMLPLVSYPQSYLPPNAPCTLATDLTSLHFLPPPNLPPMPIQNYIPYPPTQSVVYPQSIVPVDCLNTPVSPNFQISALPPVFPINVPQLCDNSRVNSQSVAEEYTPMPINLNINVPSPTIPEPKITIITFTSPPASPAPITADSSDVSFGMYPSYPLPPIIIESRRSRSRSWLPLVLVALIARDGYYDGGCCCCCNPGSSDPIPVPYPIPIPTNNPIILGNSYRARKKGIKAKGSDKKNG